MSKDIFTGRVAHLMAKDIDCCADGFYSYWPQDRGGYIEPRHLRWMADLIDWLNEPWQRQIDDYQEKAGDD